MTARVLACIDGSAETETVCDYAAWSARALDGVVEFAVAADASPAVLGTAGFGTEGRRMAQHALLNELSGLERRRRELVTAYGRDLVEAAQKHIGPGAAVVRGQLRIDVLSRIVRHTGDARLLVLSRELLLQQNCADSEAAPGCHLAAAGCSMLVVDAGAWSPPAHVAVAFDGRITGRSMIEKLVQLPLYRALRVSLVMAVPSTPGMREQASWATSQLAGAGRLDRVELLPGSPAEVITRFLQNTGADLLVLGSYHYGSLRQNVVGSTMQHLLRWQQTPTLVIR